MRDQIETIIKRVRAAPHTVEGARKLSRMLSQNGRHFHGLTPGDVERARGQILAGFEGRVLPPEAAGAIREELRTSQSPIVLAGAARALRGLRDSYAEWRDLLVASAERIALRDEFVRWSPDQPAGPTARDEIALTLSGWAGESRPCCGVQACAATASAEIAAPSKLDLSSLALERVHIEDQDGVRSSLAQLLGGRPCLIGFFYTRCMNPEKCSLMITRLAGVARYLHHHPEGRGWNVLGISYDPQFDSPERLRDFGMARAFPFGRNARLLRCVTGWGAVRNALALRVGYGTSTVNEHARECLLISRDLAADSIDCEALIEPARLLARVPLL
jgi:SCO1/SenC